eukprot:scaffold70434_cov73-Phaeocystis_antarctica.AAC.2
MSSEPRTTACGAMRGSAPRSSHSIPTTCTSQEGGSRRGIGLVGWPIAPSVGPEVVEQLQWRRR